MPISTHPVHVLPKLSMVFQPETWNDHRMISKTNCLAYALDCPDVGVPFIGQVRPLSALEKDMTPVIQARLDASSFTHIKLLFSGLARIREHQHSPETHHIIAYSPVMKHFFRLDGDRTWSHKQGASDATNKDIKDQIITNPETASFHFRSFDSTAFYIKAQKTIEEVRKDCLYPPRVKQELIQRQRQQIISNSPFDPAEKKIIYLALPKEGIVVIPKGLA